MTDINTPEGTTNTSSSPPSAERRRFLQLSALGGAVAGLSALPDLSWAEGAKLSAAEEEQVLQVVQFLEEMTIAEMQEAMNNGRLTAVQLTQMYRVRIRIIDEKMGLRSVIQLNPDALRIARDLDAERRRQGPRGPLHGIPVMLKDNIDTGDQMRTTAGSLALLGDPALQDATVAERLRAAGAVILGKTNLSEWANFRGFDSSSGWSGVGGQTANPYILDRNPCGSSSGSGAAVSANLCAAALGTETDGSIVCPASACGVVGIKPTVGLTSRAGVVPISTTQDSVGIHGRRVADAAALLGLLTGVDPRDPATDASDGNSFNDYTQFLDPNGLQGARIGVLRHFTTTTETEQVYEQAIATLSAAGATVVDPVEIPSFDAFSEDDAEIIVLIYEFKRALNDYLATRGGVPVTTLAEAIQFNLDNSDRELRFFGQEFMELAEAEIFSETEYLEALERGPRLAGLEGIDAALAANDLDALVAPTNSPAWPTDLITGDCFQFGSSGFAAVAGYPLVTVPAGFVFDLPVGLTFMASAWNEPTLIRLASGFEAANPVRRAPRFLRSFNPGARSRPRPNNGQAQLLKLKQRLLQRLGERRLRAFYL